MDKLSLDDGVPEGKHDEIDSHAVADDVSEGKEVDSDDDDKYEDAVPLEMAPKFRGKALKNLMRVHQHITNTKGNLNKTKEEKIAILTNSPLKDIRKSLDKMFDMSFTEQNEYTRNLIVELSKD